MLENKLILKQYFIVMDHTHIIFHIRFMCLPFEVMMRTKTNIMI